MGIKNGRSCAPAILCTDLFLCLLSDNFKILIFNFGFSISSVFFCKCKIRLLLFDAAKAKYTYHSNTVPTAFGQQSGE